MNKNHDANLLEEQKSSDPVSAEKEESVTNIEKVNYHAEKNKETKGSIEEII